MTDEHTINEPKNTSDSERAFEDTKTAVGGQDEVGPATVFVDELEHESVTRSLSADAFRSLRRNPMFWISGTLIVIVLLMAAWPSLFTNTDPSLGNLAISMQKPSAEHWFGTDRQGYDIFSRSIYGARASVLVGVIGTLLVLVLGSGLGLVAGYVGGWVDTLISRVGDIFFAIPLLMAGIVLIASLRSRDDLWGVPLQGYFGVIMQVVLVFAFFGWPSLMRLMRSSVIQVKPNDYVLAARALGASPLRIIRRHVLPNAMAPAIVVTTINLGAYISAEAALSFLGIGLVPPAISWGVMINDGLVPLRTDPYVLFFPALFLSITVLAFIMLGDAVRDAFDPKSR